MTTFDHRDLWSSLPAETRQGLLEKSNAPGLKRLAAYFSIMIGLGLWISQGWAFWPLAIVPLGIFIVFLFTLLHETTHKTAFASDRINNWVAIICGFVLVIPPLWFRYFHFAHHRHTQDPENDPELEGGKPETLWAYIWHVSGIPLWGSLVSGLFTNALGTTHGRYIPPKAFQRIRREARIVLGLYVAVFAMSLALRTDLLIWVWVVPALLGQPFLRLYLLAEHGRCPMVSNMLENTRTTFTNRAVRFLAWNMPFHAEHHAVPTVPFHKLPQLHAVAVGHLGTVSNGYGEFNKDYLTDIVATNE